MCCKSPVCYRELAWSVHLLNGPLFSCLYGLSEATTCLCLFSINLNLLIAQNKKAQQRLVGNSHPSFSQKTSCYKGLFREDQIVAVEKDFLKS